MKRKVPGSSKVKHAPVKRGIAGSTPAPAATVGYYTTVETSDLWLMLLETIRYSFGRGSYIPSVCRDLVRKYRSCLVDSQIEQISHEIYDYLASQGDAPRNVFSDWTKEIWRGIIDDLGGKK